MVGTLVCGAVSRAGTMPNRNGSLVERHYDGVTLSDGLLQGIRFDIRDGQMSFRVGVRPEERGNVTIEVARDSCPRTESSPQC
jgi:hypothetical protein